MKEIILLLYVFALNICVLAQDTTRIVEYKLGETILPLAFKTINHSTPGVLFINLHDNEQTSVSAAEKFLLARQGRLLKIENRGQRIVNFIVKGKRYAFDPNRIFSPAGIDSTIMLYSSVIDPAASAEVSQLSDYLLTNYIDSSRLIIALHNNFDSTLSILTYQQEQAETPNSGLINVNPAFDPDDFMLTTDTAFFRELKEMNFNVVWQNIDSIADDGSLSVYATRKTIPYINVEAEHGHLPQQIAMLNALAGIINRFQSKAQEEFLNAAEPGAALKPKAIPWVPDAGNIIR